MNIKEIYSLKNAYIIVAVLTFIQAVFIALIITFSSIHILDDYMAASFISEVNVIPINFRLILPIVFVAFALICYLMCLHKETESKNVNVFVLIIEILLAFTVMYVISFDSNLIILFLIVGILYNVKDQSLQKQMTISVVVLLLLTNHSIVTRFFRVIDVEHYLNIYTGEIATYFKAFDSVLSTLVLIAVVGFLYLYIQNQILEGEKMRKMNEDLNELNHQLEEMAIMREKMGETKERNRLAREIHDTLGHTLTGLSIGLDACNALVDVDKEKAKEQITMLAKVARGGLKDVRQSVNKLRPDALEHNDLKEALEDMVDEFSKTTGVKVRFVCHLKSLSFQKDEEDTIYRIVQEGMTNALRHGHASNIFISFAKDRGTLIIIIEDDGIGTEKIVDGFGLHHMKERVGLLNGKVRAYSHNGFELIVEIPLRKVDEDD